MALSTLESRPGRPQWLQPTASAPWSTTRGVELPAPKTSPVMRAGPPQQMAHKCNVSSLSCIWSGEMLLLGPVEPAWKTA